MSDKNNIRATMSSSMYFLAENKTLMLVVAGGW